MRSVKISVVVPTYNAANYLRECLDSLISQTVMEIEFICVNDGSTDTSLEILKEYASKDERFRIIDVPNGGYGKAMNLGLNSAKGKYFAILEPDDYLPAADVYSKMLEQAEKHHLDFVKGSVLKVSKDKSGNIKKELAYKYPEVNKVLCPRNNTKMFAEMLPSTWAALYNLEFLRKFDICDNESPGASFQDMGFYFQTTALAEKAMFLTTVTYMYRIDNPNSSSSTRARIRFALRGEYAHIRARLEKYEPIWNQIKVCFLTRRIVSHYWIYTSLPLSQRLEYLKETRKEFIEMESFSRALLSPIHKRVMEETLISAENFMMSEALRVAQRDIIRKNAYLASLQQNYKKYRWYTIGAALTFGSTSRKLKEKAAIVAKKIQAAEQIIRDFT